MEEVKTWKVYIDRSTSVVGCGAGIFIIDPQGVETHTAIKFICQTSNNDAEYEALIREAKIAEELGAQKIISNS